METEPKVRLDMHTLLLCNDVAFLGITRNVLNQFQVAPRMVNTSAAALAMVQAHEFDAIVVDWREIDNLPEFLSAVRHSKLNHEAVLVAIVRDLLDLKQAFAAGVHFLIHKPASATQIERCLRAAYCATVSRRRKHHREPVEIVAAVSSRRQPLGEATIVNVSEGGVRLISNAQDYTARTEVSAGDEICLRFKLPEGGVMLDVSATVVWKTSEACGVKFTHVPDAQRQALEQWLTVCVERSLAQMCERLRTACA